jgi:endonuclease YncB( thermonuclease family)
VERIRLTGLDAPELDQTCTDGAGASWPCGRVASRRLAELVANEDIACATEGRDRYGRYLGRCSVNGDDLGSVLVREGLAVADRPSYLREDAEARGSRLGIWGGPFDTPRVWRDTHGESATGFDLLGWIRSWFG